MHKIVCRILQSYVRYLQLLKKTPLCHLLSFHWRFHHHLHSANPGHCRSEGTQDPLKRISLEVYFSFINSKKTSLIFIISSSGLCDYQHDLGHDGVMGPWLKDFFNKLKLYHPEIDLEKLNNNFIPRWRVTLLKDNCSNKKDEFKNELKDTDLSKDIYFNSGNGDSFCDVKCMEVVSNVRTTDESHFQVNSI